MTDRKKIIRLDDIKELDKLKPGDLIEVQFPLLTGEMGVADLKVYAGQENGEMEFIKLGNYGSFRPLVIESHKVKRNKISLGEMGSLVYSECKIELYNCDIQHFGTDKPEEYHKRWGMIFEARRFFR